jgi:hypothetical protein
MIRETSASSKPYNKELSSTNDALQNGKIAYIYPKQITEEKLRLLH